MHGFTLAELLICLAILGEISTFTIPKIFNGSIRQEKRLALAKEAVATLTALNQQYLLENGGCYPGLSCRVDPSTGNALDGLPTYTYYDTDPENGFDQLIAYYDNHLNYVEKYVDASDGNYVYYQLANGTVIGPWGATTSYYNESSQLDIAWEPDVWVDTSISDIINSRVSYDGVDSVYFYPYLFKTNLSFLSYSNKRLRIGLAYDSASSVIFDWKDHPNDTCTAVGGTNCGY